MPPHTVDDHLNFAAGRLSGCSESPRLDAEVLLCKVLGWSRPGLRLHGPQRIAAASRRTYRDLLERRAGGAPVAYLTGRREFWSLNLVVTPDVLVPRPDTEVLVERALQLLAADRPLAVLDLGTGSGAIALAIASDRPLARIVGVDVSAAALGVAARNAAELGLERIQWRTGSWFAAVAGESFDLIVANPPYIAADDPALLSLAAEPRSALTPGPTGLEAFDQIVRGAARHLTPGGALAFEHGSMQGDAVAALLSAHGFGDVRTHQDYSGKPRVTLGTLLQSASEENS